MMPELRKKPGRGSNMKKIIYGILLIAVVISGYNVWKIVKSTPQGAVVDRNKITVTQKINIDSSGEFVAYDENAGITALDLLQQTSIVRLQGTGVAAFVVGINDRIADSKKKEYWALYVNGIPASVGAGSYRINEGDKIEWKIEKF